MSFEDNIEESIETDTTESLCTIQDIEESSSSNTNKRKRLVGRPKNQIWNEFLEYGEKKKGHVGSICKHCGDNKLRGRLPEMQSHIAFNCQEVPTEIKQYWMQYFIS
ncbi:12208_t:CDS:1, partial [Acaulospora morrowiae]